MIEEKGYGDILEKVLRDVKDRKEGVLYACIEIMAPENSDEITEHFSINQSDSFWNDLQVLQRIPSLQPILRKIDPLNIQTIMNIMNKPIPFVEGLINSNSGFSVGLIIVVALGIVGSWNLLRDKPVRRSERTRGKYSGNSLDRDKSLNSQKEKRGADLWLVIPCNRINLSLRKDLSNKSISYNKTVLIDESVYFLATETTKKYDPQISANNDWQSFPEGGDLFVQLYIPDGGDLVGDDLKRSLSRKIADKEIITINEIALLNDFNGLQEFNRA